MQSPNKNPDEQSDSPSDKPPSGGRRPDLVPIPGSKGLYRLAPHHFEPLPPLPPGAPEVTWGPVVAVGIKVERRSDGKFVATSPQLPELVAEGDTFSEAWENASEALSFVRDMYEQFDAPLPKEIVVDVPDPRNVNWNEPMEEREDF